MRKINDLLQKILIFLLQVYRYFISPLLGRACRFYPSCSEYALIAVKQHGYQGLYMTIKRLLCCHPWHPGGYDPVQKSAKSTTTMS
jgi:uncharacterized protein